MQRTIDYLTGVGQKSLVEAGSLVRSARDVIVTGIGASWNAALSAGAMFFLGGRPVYMQEAGELLHFANVSRGSVIIVISRTGRKIGPDIGPLQFGEHRLFLLSFAVVHENRWTRILVMLSG